MIPFLKILIIVYIALIIIVALGKLSFFCWEHFTKNGIAHRKEWKRALDESNGIY